MASRLAASRYGRPSYAPTGATASPNINAACRRLHPPKRLAHPRSPIPPLSTLTSRATHAHPTSPRSTGFCAIWDCISSSSSSEASAAFPRRRCCLKAPRQERAAVTNHSTTRVYNGTANAPSFNRFLAGGTKGPSEKRGGCTYVPAAFFGG